jgi:hypothetical protein
MFKFCEEDSRKQQIILIYYCGDVNRDDFGGNSLHRLVLFVSNSLEQILWRASLIPSPSYPHLFSLNLVLNTIGLLFAIFPFFSLSIRTASFTDCLRAVHILEIAMIRFQECVQTQSVPES